MTRTGDLGFHSGSKVSLEAYCSMCVLHNFFFVINIEKNGFYSIHQIHINIGSFFFKVFMKIFFTEVHFL